jgi:hypothetical protein
MDINQEAANLAQIKSYRLNIWLVLIAIVQTVTPFFLIWVTQRNQPSQRMSSGQEGAFIVTGWLPIVFLLCSSAATATALLIVAAKRWRNQRLTGEIETIRAEIGKQREKAAEAIRDAKEARREALATQSEKHAVEIDRAEVHSRLVEVTGQLDCLKWLSDLANEQAKDISEHVKITAVKAGRLILSNGPRNVTVALRIRNESVFEITIHPENITGCLFFNTKPSREPARVLDTDRPPIENLKPKQEETLVIEQPLWQSEAETISEADGESRFWIGNLSIPISVGNVLQQVEAKDLRIRAEIEHIYLKDFGFGRTALILDEHAMTPKELLHNIDQLRPTLRAKVYQATLGAYVETLHQANQEEEDRDPES